MSQMFSNAHNFTLTAGVCNNASGNIVHNTVHNTVYGRKRRREEIEDGPDSLPLKTPARKRRRGEEEDGIEVVLGKDLKLTLEIGSGPGYLHAGENKKRAVIVKVFHPGPTVREQLELTVSLSKGFLHPNLLRVEDISSPAAPTQFIACENARWKTAEGPLAVALQEDLAKSIDLGLKMIAGLSAGMNYLSIQAISLASLGVENFNIFLNIDDRFLISINPPTSTQTSVSEVRQCGNNATRAWNLLNMLCQ